MSRQGLYVCWDVARVAGVVGLTANMEAQRDDFLATHAPVVDLRGSKGFRAAQLSEGILYEELLGSWDGHIRDISALIHGAAGSGKSHLIYWLKLRFDHDARPGVRVVLVRRRSGSLRDALTQLVEQLGGSFARYLDPVKQALERLSPESARRGLLLKLADEFGPLWAQRNGDPLAKRHPRLEHLDEAVASTAGFGGWLARDGGVLDRTVAMLTAGGDVRDRDARPRFADEDVRPLGSLKGTKVNSGNVRELIDELDYEAESRATAVRLLNEALDFAVAALTGLSGDKLADIFAAIRRDLKSAGQRLVLLVEDVSAMAVLDVEIVRAVEPKGDSSLCPLMAVMGVTGTGFSERLRDNDKQRLTHIAELGGDAKGWREPRALAAFAARYLNALRMAPADVRAAATRRLDGGDVSRSACGDCGDRKRCHAAFGAATFGDVAVGLYPLTQAAPAKLLDALRVDESRGVSATPRGFLKQILSELVLDTDALNNGEFPSAGATREIEAANPHYFGNFVNKYAGRYTDGQKGRARQLLSYWVNDAGDADAAAAALDPLREILRLPEFAKAPKVPPPVSVPSEPGPSVPSVPSVPGPSIAPFLKALQEWAGDKPLPTKIDTRVRQHLADLVRKSIPWSDFRVVPPTEFERWLKDGYDAVRVEGQQSNPIKTSTLPIQFPRDNDTRELVEALERFDALGKRTWAFENAAQSRRVVSRWLRSRGEAFARTFRPAVEDVESGVRAAAAVLAVAAMVRRRAMQAETPAVAFADALQPLKDKELTAVAADRATAEQRAGKEPATLAVSRRWREAIESMRAKHADLVRFVAAELDAPQGSGGTNFLDSLPVLRCLERGDDLPPLAFDAGLVESSRFWKTRFRVLDGLAALDLPAALAEERAALEALATKCVQALAGLGYEGEPRPMIEAMAADVASLVKSCKEADFVLRDEAFDDLVRAKAFARQAGWAKGVEDVNGGLPDARLAAFDPRPLIELEHVLGVVARRAAAVEDEIDTQERQLRADGDADAAKADLLRALAALAGEGDDVETEIAG